VDLVAARTGCIDCFINVTAGTGKGGGTPHNSLVDYAGGAAISGILAGTVAVEIGATAEQLGAALAGKVVGAASGIGSACFQGIERIAQETLDFQWASGAGGMDKTGGIGMALLAVGCPRIIKIVAGMAAGCAGAAAVPAGGAPWQAPQSPGTA